MTPTTRIRLALLAMSSFAICQSAAATEPADALSGIDDSRLAEMTALASPRLLQSETLDLLRESARQTHAGRREAMTTLRPLAIKRGNTPAMIEKIIELEALPFVKVSDKNNSHRVYFGISFDGVLGLHGNF